MRPKESMFLRIAVAAGATLALSGLTAKAHASFMASVAVSTSAAGGGLIAYNYTVTDAPSSTDNIGQFSINVPTNANLVAIMAPAGYIIDYTPGDTIVSFESPSASLDLTPGRSETFSFNSLLGPRLRSYILVDYNNFDSLSGLVNGPSTVVSVAPEPSSIALLGTGLLGVGAAVRRRMS